MKIKVILSLILGILLCLFLLDLYNLKEIKLNKKNELSNNISYMVFDSDSNNYIKQDSIPTGGYQLNEERSYCINGGKINNYNSTNGTLQYTFQTIDECYVYFDSVPYLSNHVIALATGEDRTSLTDGTVYKVEHETVDIYNFVSEGYLQESDYTISSTSGAFIYDSVNNKWVAQNSGSNSMTFNVPSGDYKVCVNDVYNSSFDIVKNNQNGYYFFKDICFPYTVKSTDTIKLNDIYKGSSFSFEKGYKEKISEVSAGYRYEGANPDNWISYNDELWRIVAVENGSQLELDSNKYYTKIQIGSSVSDLYSDMFSMAMLTPWSDSVLYNSLNSNYLNNIEREYGGFWETWYYIGDNGISDSARSMIARYNGKYATWYFNGLFPTSLLNASAYYVGERSASGGVLTEGDSYKTPGAVGIISASDYGYAMYGGAGENTCTNDIDMRDYSVESLNCVQYSWMKGTPTTNDYYYPEVVINTSWQNFLEVGEYGLVNFARLGGASVVFRPALYLDSSVEIIGGDGSQGNPYQLAMN